MYPEIQAVHDFASLISHAPVYTNRLSAIMLLPLSPLHSLLTSLSTRSWIMLTITNLGIFLGIPAEIGSLKISVSLQLCSY